MPAAASGEKTTGHRADAWLDTRRRARRRLAARDPAPPVGACGGLPCVVPPMAGTSNSGIITVEPSIVRKVCRPCSRPGGAWGRAQRLPRREVLAACLLVRVLRCTPRCASPCVRQRDASARGRRLQAARTPGQRALRLIHRSGCEDLADVG